MGLQNSDLESNKDLSERFFNYAKVVMFLTGSLSFWIFFGWLADYSFPFGQVLDVYVACFKGTLSERVNNLQQKFQNTDIISQPDNQRQVRKLTKLESEAWLYKGILERLGKDPSVNHERIARTLEALESKRSGILRELEPRRPQKYRAFAEIQQSARIFLASQAEEDYEQLDRLVTNLVLFAKNRQPSQIILSEIIERITVLITRNSNQISPYRLRLVYKIEDLIRILSTKLILEGSSSRTDSNYQAIIDELHSRLNLLSQQFSSLLRSRQENINRVNNSRQEISGLYRDISDLQKALKMTKELDKKRQAEIDTLRSQLSQKELELQKKSETEQRYKRLYQQQQDEISNLKAKHFSGDQSQFPSLSEPPQQPVRETKDKITEQEYERIINKGDYEYVASYRRQDGTPVRGYYRRRRSR